MSLNSWTFAILSFSIFNQLSLPLFSNTAWFFLKQFYCLRDSFEIKAKRNDNKCSRQYDKEIPGWNT